jgi:hypothetical protein
MKIHCILLLTNIHSPYYRYMEVKSVAKFTFEALPPMKLKGKEHLVPIFKPVLSTSTAHSPVSGMTEIERTKLDKTVIVGRATAQGKLQQHVDELFQGGGGGIVIIVGHAGLGKSVLLKDAIRMANTKPIKTFVGAGDSMESSTPYYAWRNIFAEALELSTLDGKEQRVLHVKVVAGEDPLITAVLPLINAVIPLDLPENEETQSMSKQVRGTVTQKLLMKILQKVVSRRFVIFLVIYSINIYNQLTIFMCINLHISHHL